MEYMSSSDGILDPAHEKRKSSRMRWTDTMWIFVFILIIIGFAVIAGIDLADYNKTKCFRQPISDSRRLLFEPDVLIVLSLSILLTLALSGLYYALAATVTKQFITTTMLVQVAVTFGAAIFYFVAGRPLTGVGNIMWMVATLFVWYNLRANLDYATAFLQVVMSVTEHTPTTVVVTILGVLYTSAWSVLMGSVMMAGFGKASSSRCAANGRQRPESEFLGLLVYLSIANFIVTEVVKSIVRFTVCYVYGAWYYGAEPESSTAWDGIRYAFGKSLGSLCFAGFWLAVFSVAAQLVNTIAQMMILDNTQGKDAQVVIIVWGVNIGLSGLERLLCHFTNYVVVHIAMFNHTYMQGAQSTWAVVRTEGWHALVVNDFLACGALTFGAWCVGAITALGCYVYMWQFTEYPPEGIHFIATYVTLISAQISSIFFTGIAGGAQTLFVTIAQNPEVLKIRHPEYYDFLSQFTGRHLDRRIEIRNKQEGRI